nr:hypothetical protein [uncultured Sulfurimonas sp.]
MEENLWIENEDIEETYQKQIYELSNDLQQYKEEAEEEKKQLVDSVNSLMKDKKSHENLNIELKHQINQLLANLKKSEEKIEKVQRESSINDIEIEPKVYLKGMYNNFDFETNSLSVFIDSKEYFYSLDDYQCSHLPITGSRLLVFKSEDNKNLIYGFDISKIIDNAKKVKADIKFLSKTQNRLKLYTQEYGYMNFTPTDSFFEKYAVTIGDTIILNQIFIDGNYHFCVSQLFEGSVDRNEVLKTLQGENI